uniref:BZIP domain-containing protein n=1 Tax=Panagrolaimus davidi TaxID=227884 RepID=A0A914QT91_9BILA
MKNSTLSNNGKKLEAQKKYLKRKDEERKKKKAQVEKLEAKNEEYKNEFETLKKTFDTLLPQLCTHDKETAKNLWERALSNKGSPNPMPGFCGCNES